MTNQDRIYVVYRVSAEGEWSLSGNLTAAEASTERDHHSQQIPTGARYWIEMRRG